MAKSLWSTVTGGFADLGGKVGGVLGDAGTGLQDGWNVLSGQAATRDATKAQVKAGEQASKDIGGGYDQAMGYQQPYQQGGQQDYATLRSLVNGGSFDQQYPGAQFRQDQYQAPQFNFQADPGYQFRMSEGLNAINQSAAAKGSQLSSGNLRDLAGFSSGLASQEYGNAYNRFSQDRGFGRDVYGQDRNFGYGQYRDNVGDFQGQQQRRYSRLADLAGYGTQASNNLSNLASSRGTAIGNVRMGIGNAQAQGLVGGYNTQRDTAMGILNLGMKGAGLLAGG